MQILSKFINTVIQLTNGNVLKVCERDQTSGRYILECSLCSKDSELWPYGSITSTKSDLNRGRTPCGCSKAVKWSEDQYKTKVKRYCCERGFEFLGWSGVYKNNLTKVVIKETVSGDIWDSSPIKTLLTKRTGNPKRRGENAAAVRKTDLQALLESAINDRIIPKGSLLRESDLVDSRGYHVYLEFYCPTCAQDEYTKAGISDGWFSCLIKSIKQGSLPCRCSKSYRFSKLERELAIKHICNIEGFKFLGWENDYINGYSKFNWVCECCGLNTTSVYNFIHHNRCCKWCSESGFHVSKPATLYLVRWLIGGESYLKFGITNRRPIERIKEHCSVIGSTFEVLHLIENESGFIIKEAEDKIKSSMSLVKEDLRDRFKSGFSEVAIDSAENLEIFHSLVKTLSPCDLVETL